MDLRWSILYFLICIEIISAFDIQENTVNTIRSDEKVMSDNTASDIVRKVIAKGCAKKYTMTCFKMDMVQLVDLLSATTTYQIFPGIAVVKDNSTSGSTDMKLPEKVIRSLATDYSKDGSSQLDEYLISKISNYLSTHSVSLKLMEPSNESENGITGRGKGGHKGGYGSLMAGVMMMKGTLMTIGFGALAALAGKALMTGLLSLMLSAIIGLRSANGQFQRQTTYEIISKPIYSHSHSSEISHDHHDHGHHSSYSYGRNLDFNDENYKSQVEYVPLPMREEDEEDVDRPHHGYNYNSYGNIEYKTITEDDLKAYYNNLEFNKGKRAALYNRNGKSLSEKIPEKFDTSTFVPVPALLNPELKPAPK